ncbi:MAG: transketolase C-terminal domain-containing protein [Candidatus Pacebacteria bacterium]|nr:transketolase C-terminal domain-containing protein [Candidatus Paceibacterota bacterium]
MLNDKLKLNKNIFNNPERRALRDGFGEGLVLAGEENKNVVALSADLEESTRISDFKNLFNERFFEVGVAEQNLAAVASGFGISGKIPFISSYAVFSPGRNWEQIRTTICLNDSNVKIAGHHAGLSVGPDGGSHQALEDLALMRVLPGLRIFIPCDALEAKRMTIAASKIYGPIYLRFARASTPVITSEETPFNPGSSYLLWESNLRAKTEVAIIGAGPILYEALLAARELESEKIPVSVLNLHTLKPFDESAVLELAKKTKAIVSVEEHQISGGLGSAISELLSKKYPIPMEFVGVNDSFGESGQPDELIKKYGLDSRSIIKAVKKVIKRK